MAKFRQVLYKRDIQINMRAKSKDPVTSFLSLLKLIKEIWGVGVVRCWSDDFNWWYVVFYFWEIEGEQ